MLVFSPRNDLNFDAIQTALLYFSDVFAPPCAQTRATRLTNGIERGRWERFLTARARTRISCRCAHCEQSCVLCNIMTYFERETEIALRRGQQRVDLVLRIVDFHPVIRG